MNMEGTAVLLSIRPEQCPKCYTRLELEETEG